MSCLGVLFSLSQAEADELRAFASDAERLEHLQNGIEEVYFEKHPERVAELDSAWDALHRSLTDGRLAYDNGDFPLSHVILGGEVLYTSGDYIMTLKSPVEVKAIATRLATFSDAAFRAGYHRIDESDYGFPLSEEDFAYTLENLNASKPFWMLAAKEGRYVLFTADQ